MSVAGALIGGAIGAYGKKPKVPTLQEINVDTLQGDTVKGNISNFSDIAKLATQVNTFNQDQLNALLDRALPGAREKIGGIINSQLKGEVPEDVSNAITRAGAGRFAGALTRGSGFANNVTARDLGLTSLQIIDKGLSSAESWLSRATAPQMDVTSMFFTPQQRLGFAQQQQGLKFERDMIEAGVKAAPDPATAALGKEIDRFFNTWASVGMGALGGMGGMGGGGMGGLMGGGGGGGGGLGGGGGWLNSQVGAGSAGGKGLGG
jgi:hypothetical protein